MSDKDDIETVSFKEFEDQDNSQSIESNQWKRYPRKF